MPGDTAGTENWALRANLFVSSLTFVGQDQPVHSQQVLGHVQFTWARPHSLWPAFAPDDWPQQRDPCIPIDMWEAEGFPALSQLRKSMQEKRQHKRSSEVFTSERSILLSSQTEAGVDFENHDLRLNLQKWRMILISHLGI